jgi:5-methyltetrahydrofolate--homocysteine methyltransferase
MNKLETLLHEDGVIVADGAMGTMLISEGLKQGEAPHLWNLEYPERVARIHRAYLDAGSKLLLTNTFSANPFRMLQQDSSSSLIELNQAGARILRSEVDAAGENAIVAGDIGPSGKMLAPYGELSFEEAKAGFAQQAAGLIDGGVDVLWIETMAALEEVRAAFEGIREASDDIPILTTMTFDTQGRTMMGVTPEQAAHALQVMGAAAIGGNCGKGPDEMVAAIEEMHRTIPDAILITKANAGLPEVIDGETVYNAEPSSMATYALQAFNAGARIIGACCGSTPAHIRAMAEALTAMKL